MSSTRSTQERYLGARRSSNLRLVVDNTGSADLLIAAGWVARASERKSVALAIAGVMASERMAGANAVAEVLAGWLVKRSQYRSNHGMAQVQAHDLALTVLKWWQRPTCLDCGGHGHPLLPNSPVIDETRECPTCLGTGKIPMARIVRSELVDPARWLSNEIEVIYGMVFGQIKRRMQ